MAEHGEPAIPPSTLDVALRYAQLGLRVLPIKPGTKRPPMNEWVQAATTNPDIITSWYTEKLYRDHGVGLALGWQPDGRMIFALDVDEHDPAHSGIESLADLEGRYGSLPDTWRSLTGSAGLHLLYTSTTEVRNGTAGDGLDVRGAGGQIVVHPSIHPTTNRVYEWEHGYAPWEHPIAEAPDWLLDIVLGRTLKNDEAPAAPAPPVTAQFATPDGPAEWLRSQWDWPFQLNDAGWMQHHIDRRNGDQFWTRPGKDPRAGESAVVHQPDGPFVIFSTDVSMTTLRAMGRVNKDGSVTLAPFDFYAAHRHGGDRSAAARAINVMRGDGDSHLSAAPTSSSGTGDPRLDALLAQVIQWDDFWQHNHSGEAWLAEPVIAAERQTVLYAPAKQGKSEVALAIVAAIATGRAILGQRNYAGPKHVIWLDYEMVESDLLERLEALGYSDTDDLSYLHYWSLPSLPPLDTQAGCDVVRGLAAHFAAELVVIDTMGRAVEGLENDNDTYRAYARLTGLMLKADGRAVLRTDHAGKEAERGQRGASAKNDDADVVLRVERTNDGWRLKRTHARVNWVPETTLIDRAVDADGNLLIRWNRGSVPAAPAGTDVLVKEMKAAGIDGTMTTRQAADLMKQGGIKAKATKRDAALRWMRTELGAFVATDSHLSPNLKDVT